MPVQKIKAGRIVNVEVPTYVGNRGVIFFDEDVAELRLGDGITPGGIPFSFGGSIDAVLYLDGGDATSVYTGSVSIDGGGI